MAEQRDHIAAVAVRPQQQSFTVIRHPPLLEFQKKADGGIGPPGVIILAGPLKSLHLDRRVVVLIQFPRQDVGEGLAEIAEIAHQRIGQPLFLGRQSMSRFPGARRSIMRINPVRSFPVNDPWTSTIRPIRSRRKASPAAANSTE